MEKKGDVLTQMALISDLLEKANLESEETVVVFRLKPDEFKKVFEKVSKKANIKGTSADKTFSVRIGEIEFVYSISKNSA